MTPKEIAEQLDGTEYPLRLTQQQKDIMREAGIIIVSGHSDDVPSVYGAYEDEASSMTFRVTKTDVEDENVIKGALIRASYGVTEPYWQFVTDAPHETLRVMEDGEVFSQALVISLADLDTKAIFKLTPEFHAMLVVEGKPIFDVPFSNRQEAEMALKSAEMLCNVLGYTLTMEI